jgi:predicted nucleotidyltransferase
MCSGVTGSEDIPGRGRGYSGRVIALAEASLSDAEQRAVARFVDGLVDAFSSRLQAVWLYGSRARGEPPHDESDIDVLVVVDSELPDDNHRAVRAAAAAERAEGVGPVLISTIVYDTKRVARRREIESFFIQEVDRDKIVLYGEP